MADNVSQILGWLRRDTVPREDPSRRDRLPTYGGTGNYKLDPNIPRSNNIEDRRRLKNQDLGFDSGGMYLMPENPMAPVSPLGQQAGVGILQHQLVTEPILKALRENSENSSINAYIDSKIRNKNSPGESLYVGDRFIHPGLK